MDLSVIIPCYNEVENMVKLRDELLPVLQGLTKSYEVEVVFVDDGSTDGTWPALIENFGDHCAAPVVIRLERHESNRGLGAALRTGLSVCRGQIIVTTDSDGTYDFTEIPNLLSHLVPGVDLVTASPYHPDGEVVGVPAYRLLFSKGASAIYRQLVSRQIYTYTSLFRAYRREAVADVSLESNGFLGVTELLVKAMLLGRTVREYPAVLRLRAYGTSKAKITRTVLSHLRFQGRILLHRLGLQPLALSRPSA
jgi:dolichol-phosphate mannosyltransferase